MESESKSYQNGIFRPHPFSVKEVSYETGCHGALDPPLNAGHHK